MLPKRDIRKRLRLTLVLCATALCVALSVSIALAALPAGGSSSSGAPAGQDAPEASPSPSCGYEHIDFNLSQQPFNDVNIRAAYAYALDHVTAVGERRDAYTAFIGQLAGQTWTEQPVPFSPTLSTLSSIASDTQGGNYAAGSYFQGGSHAVVIHQASPAISWTVSLDITGTGAISFSGVSTSSPTNVVVDGTLFTGMNNYGVVYQYNGTSWSQIPLSDTFGFQNTRLTGVVTFGTGSIVVAGWGDNGPNTRRTLAAFYNQGTWARIPTQNTGTGDNVINGIGGTSPTNLWVGGGYTGLDGYLHATVQHGDISGLNYVPLSGVPSTGSILNGSPVLDPYNNWWAAGDATDNSGQVIPLALKGNAAGMVSVPPLVVGTHDNLLNGVAALPTGPASVIVYGYRNDANSVSHALIEAYTPCSETPTPTPVPTACPISFTDVHQNDYFYQGVLYLYCHNDISGYSTSPPCLPGQTPCFQPYNNTTRGQMMKIVVLGFSKTIYTPPGGNYTFADVLPASTFFPYVETGAHDNIVSGYACGGPGEPCDAQHRPYFRPGNLVTRGQLSKIDALAAGWNLLNPTTGSFEDVLPNTAFYQYVETAYCHGVISGYACGGPGEACDPQHRPYFRQQNNAIRGQISKIVYQSITNPPGSCNPTATPTTTPTTGIK